MQLPIMAAALLVTAHAEVFRDLCENRRQLQQNSAAMISLRWVFGSR